MFHKLKRSEMKCGYHLDVTATYLEQFPKTEVQTDPYE